MKIKKINEKINSIAEYIDKAHLEAACLIVVFIIMLPILILKKGAIFPVLDQLDETILNYVFPARFSGAKVYESMMCGVPATSLKPFAPGFVLFYKLFDPFTAFVLQYLTVILTAALGTYGCVKKLSDSSIAAFLAGSVFALLPFRSIYGISLAATPFLVFCILSLSDAMKAIDDEGKLKESENSSEETPSPKIRYPYLKLVLSYAGLVFYAFFSSLVLVGYAALIVMFLYLITMQIICRKSNKALFISMIVITAVYVLTNLDLFSQLITGGEFVSHREEYVISGFNFWGTFKGMMLNGMQHYESFHKFIFIPVIAALPFAVIDIVKKKKLGRIYFVTALLMVVTGLLYAFFASDFLAEIRNGMTGMLKTFQAQRFYWLLPGGWYVALGISLALIYRYIASKSALIGGIVVIVLYIPTLLYVGKNPDGIFYQNINQINNGSDITGYISWEALYAEDLMDKIESDIGKDMSSYRIAHIAMSPAPALMHGFYTVDGYSNDYPIEYKHRFEAVIARELDKNDICSDYFRNWGNRCYLFYADFGGAYMIDKNFTGSISGMEFDLDKLREMGCKYIFSGAEIADFEAQGLSFIGEYSDETSYWKIRVYGL